MRRLSSEKFQSINFLPRLDSDVKNTAGERLFAAVGQSVGFLPLGLDGKFTSVFQRRVNSKQIGGWAHYFRFRQQRFQHIPDNLPFVL